MLVFLLACDPPPSSSDRVLFTDLGGGEPADTGSPPAPGLRIELVDDQGAAGTGWPVYLLSGAREMGAETDAQGQVIFEIPSPGTYALQPVPPEGLARPLLLLNLQEGEASSLQLQVPRLSAASPLGEEPRLVSVGEGLELEAALGDLEPAPFEPPIEALAGARAELELLEPSLLAGLPDEVLAVWYLYPLAAAPSGLPLRVTEPLGLSPGETAQVWVTSPASQRWSEAGTLVSDGATLTGDARLLTLSTVAITRN